VTIEDGVKEPLLRDRLAYYPLLFGVTKVEMLPSLPEHDAVFGIETERRREILKGFIEKHFRSVIQFPPSVDHALVCESFQSSSAITK